MLNQFKSFKTKVKMRPNNGPIVWANCDNCYRPHNCCFSNSCVKYPKSSGGSKLCLHRKASISSYICLIMILIRFSNCVHSLNATTTTTTITLPTTTTTTLLTNSNEISDYANIGSSSDATTRASYYIGKDINNSEVDLVSDTNFPVSPYIDSPVEDLQAVESTQQQQQQQQQQQHQNREFRLAAPYTTVISILPPVISYENLPSAINQSASQTVSQSAQNQYQHQSTATLAYRIPVSTGITTTTGPNSYPSVSETPTMRHSSIDNNTARQQATITVKNQNKTNVGNAHLQYNNNKLLGPKSGKSLLLPGRWAELEDQEERERQRTLDIVRHAHENLLESVMVTNKTRAFLTCKTGDMLIKLNFSEPFRGIVYANHDRSTPCKLLGDGQRQYELRLPLRGCGTKQEAPRLFLNNILIRFHRSLELDEDEVKTVVCRYPPPLAPPPAQQVLPERILDSLPEPAKLTNFDPLFILAGLLFLTLLLLGLSFGAVAAKRQASQHLRNEVITQPKVPIPPSVMAQTVYDSFVETKSIAEVATNHLSTLNKSAINRDVIKPARASKTVLKPQAANTLTTDETIIVNKADKTNVHILHHHKQPEILVVSPHKYTIKNIEDTYTTRIDEIDEIITTTCERKRQDKILYNTLSRESKIPTNNKLQPEKPTTGNDDQPTSIEVDNNFVMMNNSDNSYDNDSANDARQRELQLADIDGVSVEDIPFVSMRPTLTSPEQFKRLQTIVDIFDETIIEHHKILDTSEADKNNLSGTDELLATSGNEQQHEIVYESRPRMSRYRSAINELDVGQRRQLHKLLTSDENFRSFIVECTTLGRISRKLRQNPMYCDKINGKTWSLLTRVLIDTACDGAELGVRKFNRNNNNNNNNNDSNFNAHPDKINTSQPEILISDADSVLSVGTVIKASHSIIYAGSIPDYSCDTDSLNNNSNNNNNSDNNVANSLDIVKKTATMQRVRPSSAKRYDSNTITKSWRR